MPSVLINEKDYTIYNRELSTDNIVYVPGFSIKGPYDRPVLLESYRDLVRIFGDSPTETYRPSDSTSSTYAMGTSWEYAAGLLNAGFIVLFHRIVPHIINHKSKAVIGYGLGTEYLSETGSRDTDDDEYETLNLAFNKNIFASAGVRLQLFMYGSSEGNSISSQDVPSTTYELNGSKSTSAENGNGITPTNVTYVIREKNGGSYGNRLKLSIKKNRAGNKLFYELSEVYRGVEILEYNEICRIEDIYSGSAEDSITSGGDISKDILSEKKFVLINKLIEAINTKSEIISAEKYITTREDPVTVNGVADANYSVRTKKVGLFDSDCIPYDVMISKLLFSISATNDEDNPVNVLFDDDPVVFVFGAPNIADHPLSSDVNSEYHSLDVIVNANDRESDYIDFTTGGYTNRYKGVLDHISGKDYTINDVLTDDDVQKITETVTVNGETVQRTIGYSVKSSSNKSYDTNLPSGFYDATIGEILNYYLDPIGDKILYDVKFITKGNIPYNDQDLTFRAADGESLAIRTMRLCRDDRNGDCIYITEPAKDTPKTDINDSDEGVLADFKSTGSSYVATYAPWAVVTLFNGYNRWMAPSYCFLLALAKSVDAGNPYYLPPAGVNRASLPEVVTTEYEIGSALLNKWQNKDYQVNVNPIMKLNNYGYVIYGQRTMYDVSDSVTTYRSALQEVGVRLTTIAIKKKIYKVAIGLTFEYNNIHTWNEFKARLDPLMKEMKENGALQRYKIIMDSSTTSYDDIDDNIIRGTVKVVPGRAAEDFVISFELYRSSVIFDEEDEEEDRKKIEKQYNN